MPGVDWQFYVNLQLVIMGVFIGLLGIAIVISGVLAYIRIKGAARKTAEKVAREVAEKTAERVANEYFQQNIMKIFEEYDKLRVGKLVTSEEADDIASKA